MKEATPKKNEEKQAKIGRAASFKKKASLISLKPTGEEQRPQLIRTATMEKMTDKVYSLMDSYLSNKIPDIEKQIVNHVQYTLARTRFDFKNIHCYQAAAHSVRDRLLQYFNDTHRVLNYSGKKKVYYLSIEYLIGRCFQNALINLNIQDQFKEVFKNFGYSYEKLIQKQVDAGLGNGGLGRLAACFLDSMATLNLPAWGYGIRYQYGIFKQFIKNGYQLQAPDYWLSEGNPWEIQRIDVQYKVNFYGNTRRERVGDKQKVIWQNCEVVVARAYDTPIPGYATYNTIGLRLWKSLPLNEFDFVSFNSGQYWKALEAKQRAEYITTVLYPNDSTQQGKQLRLKQEYLLVSATIQDIIRRHKSIAEMRQQQFKWEQFGSNASIQLNDTHPSLAIVELFRIMVDEEDVDREIAWNVIYNTFSYTNHTVLPEALEKWSVDLFGRLLPRHLELIYEINLRWLQEVSPKIPENEQWRLRQLSIIEETQPKQIRMANLCVVSSHKVNGVAVLHSQLLKKQLFKVFYDVHPQKFTNITNGVTTRRWIVMSNPCLADLYTQTLNTDEWLTKMDLLRGLQKYAEVPQFQSKWQAIKLINKKRLADYIKSHCNIVISQNSMFDVQIKRMHQYKRQLMNIFYVIHRYYAIKEMSPQEKNKVVPRTVIFAGKAAPGYQNAKKIIKFINEVAQVVNNDESINNLLKVVFIPNYNVSTAEIIIPATELSQHISTAGTQASGTSNMKFVLNGALIIGTMDGANIEIYEEVGQENIFIFGAREEEVHDKRHFVSSTAPENYIPDSIKKIIQAVRNGAFSDKDLILSLIYTITNNNDWYLVTQDFQSYVECQNKVDETYKNKKLWTKMSILNAIHSGKFSSDRTIKEYSENIWNVQPCKVIEDIGLMKGKAPPVQESKPIKKSEFVDEAHKAQKPQYVDVNFGEKPKQSNIPVKEEIKVTPRKTDTSKERTQQHKYQNRTPMADVKKQETPKQKSQPKSTTAETLKQPERKDQNKENKLKEGTQPAKIQKKQDLKNIQTGKQKNESKHATSSTNLQRKK